MKNFLSFSLLYIAFSLSISAQNGFEKVLHTAHAQKGLSIIQHTNGYILLSSTDSTGMINSRITKLNKAGSIMWEHVIGDTSVNDIASRIALHPNGNIIVSGYREENSLNFYTSILDTTGTIALDTSYQSGNQDIAFDMMIDSDGNISILGTRSASNYFWQVFYLLTIDINGNIINQTTVGSGTNFTWSVGLALLETAGKGTIICGSSSEFGPGNKNIYIAKLKSNGDTIWTRAYGTVNLEKPQDIVALPNGDFIVLASYETPVDSARVALLRIDSNGNEIWTKFSLLGKISTGNSMVLNDDTTIQIAGFIGNQQQGLQLMLAKYDQQGDSIWLHQYGGQFNEMAHDMIVDDQGNIAVAGFSEGFGTYHREKAYVLITNEQGIAACPGNISFDLQSEACLNDHISATNLTTTSRSLNWIWNDSIISNEQIVSFPLDSPGTQELKLSICSDTSVQQISVLDPTPDFSFMFDSTEVQYTMMVPFTIDRFRWDFGDGSIDTINTDPVHVYDSIMAYNTTLWITDQNSCEGYQLKVINLADTGTVDTFISVEPINNMELSIYPNPTYSNRIINLKSVEQMYAIELFSIEGKRIASYNPDAGNTKSINLPYLHSGIYLISIQTANSLINKKLLITDY